MAFRRLDLTCPLHKPKMSRKLSVPHGEHPSTIPWQMVLCYRRYKFAVHLGVFSLCDIPCSNFTTACMTKYYIALGKTLSLTALCQAARGPAPLSPPERKGDHMDCLVLRPWVRPVACKIGLKKTTGIVPHVQSQSHGTRGNIPSACTTQRHSS